MSICHTTMPRQVLCLSAWLAAALLLASARLRAVTFTSSLPVNATNIIGPAGAVVSVLAHSLGNIVTGEALRQLPDNLMIANYIASQAAIAGSFYQNDLPEYRQPNLLWINNYGMPDIYTSFPSALSSTEPRKTGSGTSFLTKVKGGDDSQLFRQDNPTPCTHSCPAMHNFFNAEDWALHSAYIISWESNNAHKPDLGFGYDGDKETYSELASPASQFKDGNMTLSFGYSHTSGNLANTYRIFSFIARARAKPLGTLGSVSGFSSFNLQVNNLGYDDSHYSHSRQFRSNIVAEHPYWNNVMTICAPPQRMIE